MKRLPAGRPGRGRASVYVNGAAPAVPTSDVVRSGPGGNLSWHKGSLSKRFDGKEESNPSTKTNTPTPTPVCQRLRSCVILIPRAGTNRNSCRKRRRGRRNGRHVPSPVAELGSNTRKDVTVGITPSWVLFLYSSIQSNEHLSFFSALVDLAITAPPMSTRLREEQVSEEESPLLHKGATQQCNKIGNFPLATFATVVARKVCPVVSRGSLY